MLEEEFKTQSADPIIKEILVKLDLHINILGYLKEGPPRFVELLDGNTEKNMQMIGLNNVVAILDNKQQLNLPDLNELEVKQAKKKEKKTQRQQQKKFTLA